MSIYTNEPRLIGTLTILSGALLSDALEASAYKHCNEVCIMVPSNLTGTLVTVQFGDAETNPEYGDAESPPGTPIIVTTGKRTVLTTIPAPSFKLLSDAAESDDKSIPIWGTFYEPPQ